MQFAVTFRHMEPTDALKSYARERMERVRKYLPDPISCHVVLSTERHNHRIDVTFQLHNGLSDRRSRDDREHVQLDRPVHREDRAPGPQVQGQARGHEGAAARRARRSRGRTRSSTRRSTGCPARPTVTRATRSTGRRSPSPEFKVVKTEKFHAQPMSVADAIVQLNLLHEPFLVFRHDTDGRVAVVYKREDGSLRSDRDADRGLRSVTRAAAGWYVDRALIGQLLMKIVDLIKRDMVVPALQATDKRGILEELATYMAAASSADRSRDARAGADRARAARLDRDRRGRRDPARQARRGRRDRRVPRPRARPASSSTRWTGSRRICSSCSSRPSPRRART